MLLKSNRRGESGFIQILMHHHQNYTNIGWNMWLLRNIESNEWITSLPLIRSSLLQWKSSLITEVASIEADNWLVFYYLNYSNLAWWEEWPLLGVTLYRYCCSSINITTILVKKSLKISNQNPYFEEEQTIQWPKEKVQEDRQQSTKHTHKTKDRVTRTPLKTEGELRCSRRVNSSCSTSGICRVILVTNLVICREWGKEREVFTTSGTYRW